MKTPQTTTTTLYSYRAVDISLETVIANCQQVLKGAISLLYSPTSCDIGKLTSDGKLQNSQGCDLELDNLFEVRIFNENCELRWLNRVNGHGDAALLSQSAQMLKGFEEPTKQACESLQRFYLFWGKPVLTANTTPGWQRLAEARIGKLDVPLDQALQENQRVYLSACEYLAETDRYGNMGVIAERLIELKVRHDSEHDI